MPDSLRDDEPSLIGTAIGRYRILERIGEGGMGVVYRAVQDPLERPVALKLVHRTLALEPDVVSRFLREARIAASLTNPNTVTIYDFGRAPDGGLYLAMEYVAGESLRQRIDREHCVRPTDAAVIAIQVCRSLHEAHKKHIAHRDLKPENILLTATEDGTLRVKVLDYGLARSVDPSDTSSAAQVTQVGMILGTPEYMAPEQARGYAVDTRADIYSLGVVLYEMLTGVTPFSGDTQISLMANVIVNPPPPMTEMGVRIAPPADLEALVLHMLAKEPQDRPGDVLEVLRVLKAHVLKERPAIYSQVFQDPSGSEEHDVDDVPTSAHTALPPPRPVDQDSGETSTMLPFVEGDRTIVSVQAFPEDDEEPSVTAPHAVRERLVDDSLTAPATPALLARGDGLADLAELPTIDSSVGDEAALLSADDVRDTADRTAPRPRSDGSGRRELPRESDRPPSPRAKSDPDRGFSPRAKSDPARGISPRAKSDPERPSAKSAPPASPRITEQMAGRGAADWKEQDEAHRQLAALVASEAFTLAPPPVPRRRSSPDAAEPQWEDDELADPPLRHRSARGSTTEVMPVQRTPPLTVIVGAALAVVAGVVLVLWWTGALGGGSPSSAEGLPAGYSPSVPPAVGWSGTYETTRGPLVLSQQGEQVQGTLGVGEGALQLLGHPEGAVLRFEWALRETGAPAMPQQSGRGELRWYVNAAGEQRVRATLGYGTASVGAGALWATPQRL